MSNSIKYNQGKQDGISSKGMKNPIHNNWKGKKNFCPDYEKGYWHGYNAKKDGKKP